MNNVTATTWLFVVPALLGFLLLAAHLFYHRGFATGMLLLGMVVVIAFLKEHSIETQPVQAEYHFNAIGPRLFSVPLVVVAGWFYAVYIGWCFSEGMLARSEKWRGRVFATLSLALVVTVALSFCVETAGANMGWWTWHRHNIETREVWIFNIPKFVLIGWAGFTLKALLPCFFILLPRRRLAKKIKWVTVFFIAIAVMQKLLFGLIFNIIVLLVLFTIIFVLPFKNTWRFDPPARRA